MVNSLWYGPAGVSGLDQCRFLVWLAPWPEVIQCAGGHRAVADLLTPVAATNEMWIVNAIFAVLIYLLA